MEFEIKEYNYINVDLRGKRKGQVKTVCPFCSQDRKHKDDACLSVNIDTGMFTCHHCGKNGNIHKFSKVKHEDYKVPYYHYNDDYDINQKVVDYFAGRSISNETLRIAKIDYENTYIPQIGKERNAIVFPYFKNGVCINKKFRDAEKNFVLVKDAEKTLFNIDAIADTDDMIVHEGEIDCLSSIECGFFNAVSVPNGTTKGNVNLDYIDNIYDSHIKDKKRIILAGDNDEAGKNLMQKLAERFGKGRCYIVDWGDCKDGNDYLIKYGKEEYVNAINNAEPYPVSGVYLVKQFEPKLYDELVNGTKRGSTTHMASLDVHFTWMKKDVVIFAGYPNMGKTEFEYFLNVLKSVKSGWKWAIAGLEEKDGERFFRKLIEIYVGRKLSVPNPKYASLIMTENEFRAGLDFVNSHFFWVKPETKFSKHAIFDAFDYTVAKHGVDGIIVDPFNKLVKETKAGLRDDELLVDYYRSCEEFAISHDVVSVTITHMNKPEKVIGDLVPKPSVYNILGGQATNNAVDEIVFVHRMSSDVTDPDRMITTAKVRDRDLVGIPGDMPTTFNWNTRRFLDNGNDPIVGYNVQSKRTMPLSYADDNKKDEYEIDYNLL